MVPFLKFKSFRNVNGEMGKIKHLWLFSVAAIWPSLLITMTHTTHSITKQLVPAAPHDGSTACQCQTHVCVPPTALTRGHMFAHGVSKHQHLTRKATWYGMVWYGMVWYTRTWAYQAFLRHLTCCNWCVSLLPPFIYLFYIKSNSFGNFSKS